MLAKGHHFCEHSYDIINPTEMISSLISEGKDIISGIRNVYDHLKGSCSMLLLCEDRIIAARDRYGRTPVLVAKKKGLTQSPRNHVLSRISTTNSAMNSVLTK